LAALRDQGRIGAIGVGVKDWPTCLRFARTGGFDCFMLAGGYHAAVPGFPGIPGLLARPNAISVLVAAPFNTGILATGAVAGARYFYRPAPEPVLATTRRLEALCRDHGVPLAAAALQFPLRHPAVASVVVGHQSPPTSPPTWPCCGGRSRPPSGGARGRGLLIAAA